MNKVLEPVDREVMKSLSRDELYTLIKGEQDIRRQLQEELDKIKLRYKEISDTTLEIYGKFVRLKARLFGRSSEKSVGKNKTSDKSSKPRKERSNHSKLPSERYPNTDIIEHEMSLEEPPQCDQCRSNMQDFGQAEVSEYLTIIPRKYLIVRQLRQKYRCKCCHGSIKTTPGLPRIKPGSSYSDEMIIDIAMSKYCDLIPVERYASMAEREGFEGLPANSLIEATHHLAAFLLPTKHKIKEEVLSSSVLRADETPHKMLEGDKERKNWYLWGFSSETAAYFECHNTRSGDVASSFLRNSVAEVLLSDVYSGYSKAIRMTNKTREEKGTEKLKTAFCNAHSRRKFKETGENFEKQVAFYIRCYRIIYRLESWGQKSKRVTKNRRRMKGIFVKMQDAAKEDLEAVSEKSELAKAIKYFQNNIDGLMLYLEDDRIPIDNNAQERLLRNPVIGRKTWYGTHSKKGAETAATLFTITETCKLNKINPRDYLKSLVQEIHQGGQPFTPSEFRQRVNN